MDKRTSLSVSVVVIATLAAFAGLMVGLSARAPAAETSPSGPGERGPDHLMPKRATLAANQPVAPRLAPADDPYRCHPSEDISCTVVRETAQGTLIVTVRPGGRSALTPAWMVISGTPPTPGPHPGGTVYVVPNTSADAEPMPHQAALMPANGAPILE